MTTLTNLKKQVRAALIATALVASALVTPLFPAQALSGVVETTATRTAEWLKTKQEGDGGFGSGFSKGSDIGATADVVMALAAVGTDVKALKSAKGSSPADYFARQLRLRRTISVGQYAKMALAVRAMGDDPRNFAGANLVARVLQGYDAQTGVIGDSVFVHCLGMLALARNGAEVPAKAIEKLESLQTQSGGWAFAGDDAADVDTTALCVQALIASGRSAGVGATGRALGYLRSLQNADGGFPFQVPSQFGTDSNANSSALVAQAIVAAGDQPESWAASGGNPLSILIALRQPSGAIAYQAAFADDNVLASAAAVPALMRKAYGE